MFTYLENNWMKWYYDDDPTALFRSNNDQIFNIDFELDSTPCKDLRTEMVLACQSIRDHYPNEKFSLMLSGGGESEMLVRAFKEAGVPFQVYIGRFEDYLNIYDVSHAVVACENMNVSYKFIDFNVKNFFEHDIAECSRKAQITIPPILTTLALTDRVDGIPILGDGNPELWRTTPGYDKPGTWLNVEIEYDFGRLKYFINQNRVGISDWLRWSHRLLKAYAKTKWFNDLISDKIMGKRGVHSTKIQGYREAWPELIPRAKKHGLEDIEDYMFGPLQRDLAIGVHNGNLFRQVVLSPIKEIYYDE
jgi:hypothetical protein